MGKLAGGFTEPSVPNSMPSVKNCRKAISNMNCWSNNSQNSEENDTEAGRDPLVEDKNEQYRIGIYDVKQ